MAGSQVTCLNDNLEQRWCGELLHAALRPMIAQNTAPQLATLLKLADKSLTELDLQKAWHFIACFSEVSDDHGQWPGLRTSEPGWPSNDGIADGPSPIAQVPLADQVGRTGSAICIQCPSMHL